MSYVPQHVTLRNMVVGSKKQTTYGTALLDASLTRRLRFDQSAFAAFGKEYYSDMDRAGKGHEFPTVRVPLSKDVRLSLGGDLDDFLAAWLLAFTMGNVTTTGTGPYVHTIKFETANFIAPVTTVYGEDASAIKTKWPDLAMAQLKLSGGEKGPLQFSVDLIGSGNFTDVAMAALPALPTPVYLLGSDTDILLGAPAAAASIKERVRSWEVTLVTDVEQHRAPGGGLVASFAKLGIRRATVSLVVAAKDTDDLRALMMNDTLQELQINTNSGAAAQMNLKFPNLYFKAAPQADKLEQVWKLDAAEGDVLKGAALEPFQAVVTNSETAYLAAG